MLENIQDGYIFIKQLAKQMYIEQTFKLNILIKVKVKRCPEMKSVKNYNFHRDLRDN